VVEDLKAMMEDGDIGGRNGGLGRGDDETVLDMSLGG
jgi:hypothetical protein